MSTTLPDIFAAGLVLASSSHACMVAVLCSVDWLPGFVEDYGDQVMGVETQYWAYNSLLYTSDAADE